MSLLPRENEIKLQLDLIDEGCRLYGIPVHIYDLETINMYLDDNKLRPGGISVDNPFTYGKKFFEVNILFEEYVSKRVTANLKWNNFEVAAEGMTVFIPCKFGDLKIDIIEHMIVVIRNDMYQIMEVNSTYLIGLWFVCRIVPFKPERNRPKEEDNHKSNYFKSRWEEIP